MDWVEPAALQGSPPVRVPVDRLEVETVPVADGTRVLAVRGSLDLFTAPRFEQALLAALEATERALVVDLSECDFLDSGALAVIVRRNRLLADGGHLLFVAPQRSLLRIFALTRLDGVLEIHPTRAAALARVQTRPVVSGETELPVSAAHSNSDRRALQGRHGLA